MKEMENVLITSLIGGIVAITGTILGYIGGRRKHTAETNILELESISQVINIWKETAIQQAEEIKALKLHIAELEQTVSALRAEQITLTNIIKGLKWTA